MKLKSINRWLKKVDWNLWETRPYVVVDPAVPSDLLYFSEREYKAFQKVAMSNDIQLKVIATSSSVPVENPESRKDLSPGLVSRVKSYLSRFLKGLSGNKVRQATLTKLPQILLCWGLSLALWTKQPLKSSGLYTDTLACSAYLKMLLKHNGSAFMINSMKIGLFAINSYLSGHPLTNTWSLGQAVSLRKGLPTFIPVSSRDRIRRGDVSAIRYYTSLLNSYKAFEGSYKDPDLSTIQAEPYTGQLDEWAVRVKAILEPLLNRAKSPNLKITPDNMFHSPRSNAPGGMSVLSAPAGAWALLQNGLLGSFYELCHLTNNDHIPLLLGDMVVKSANRLKDNIGRSAWCGKLCLKYEAASKIRIFAMPDYWTQVILSPLHDHLNSLLRLIPSDGTFEQEEAVNSLAKMGYTHFSSFDLKSATDTIPIQLYIPMMEYIFGEEITSCWSKLLDRPWGISWDKLSDRTIRYTRGQPIGAKSSWPAMALVHHLLVQYSAIDAGHKPWEFTAYRVLGDDLVIADKTVADAYLLTAGRFGVQVGLPKSFRSDKGFFNFANQSFLGSINLSPLSLKEELAAKSLSERSEFAMRIVRRGWLASSSPYAALRHYMTPRTWTYLNFSTLGAFQQNVPDFVKQLMMFRVFPVREISIRKASDPRFLEPKAQWDIHPLLGQVKTGSSDFTLEGIEYFAQFLSKTSCLTANSLRGELQLQWTNEFYVQMNRYLVRIIDDLLYMKMLRGGNFKQTGHDDWSGLEVRPDKDQFWNKSYRPAVLVPEGPVNNFVKQACAVYPDYPYAELLTYMAKPLSRYMVTLFALNDEMTHWRSFVFNSHYGRRERDASREEEILAFGHLLSIYSDVQDLPDFNIWVNPDIEAALLKGAPVSPWVLSDSRAEDRHFADTPPMARKAMDAVAVLLKKEEIRSVIKGDFDTGLALS